LAAGRCRAPTARKSISPLLQKCSRSFNLLPISKLRRKLDPPSSQGFASICQRKNLLLYFNFPSRGNSSPIPNLSVQNNEAICQSSMANSGTSGFLAPESSSKRGSMKIMLIGYNQAESTVYPSSPDHSIFTVFGIDFEFAERNFSRPIIEPTIAKIY